MPEVVSNGELMLVVWYEARGALGNYSLYAARVTADGELLDPNPILLSSVGKTVHYSFDVVWDGRAFLVVWAEFPRGHVARVSVDGKIVQRASFDRPIWAVAANGERVVVLTDRTPPALTCRLGELDASFTFQPIGLDEVQCDTRLFPRGDGFLALETQRSYFPPVGMSLYGHAFGSRTQPDKTFWFHEVGADGSASPYIEAVSSGDSTVILFAVTDEGQLFRLKADGTHTAPLRVSGARGASLVANPNGTVDLFTVDSNRILRYRVSDDSVYRTDTLTHLNVFRVSAVSTRNGTFIVSYNRTIEGRFVDRTGPAVPISIRAERQARPAIAPARDGRQLAVWLESLGPRSQPDRDIVRIMARPLHRDGSPAGEPFIVEAASPYARPAVAFDGNAHVVVWQDAAATQSGEVRARWLGGSGGGMVLASNGLYRTRTAVASDGVSTVAAYTVNYPGTLVTRSLSGPAIESEVPGARDEVAMATSGEHYLVVANSVSGGIRSAVVDRTGVVRSSDELTLPGARNPAVAWNGSAFFVVFERDGSLYGTFASRDGVPSGVETRLATPSAGKLEEASVIWDGASFVVAFTLNVQGRTDLYARRIDANGSPRGDASAVSKSGLDDGQGALVSHGGGMSTIIYTRLAPEVTTVSRIFTRKLGAPKRRVSGH